MKDLSIKKLYYSISEVSKITDIEQYVLRYWETEFEQLKPQKNRAGNRIYTNKDIKLILKIKELLREKKYTIEGAKAIVDEYEPDKEKEKEKDHKYVEVETDDDYSQEDLFEEPKNDTEIKKDLEEIKSFLEYLLNKLK